MVEAEGDPRWAGIGREQERLSVAHERLAARLGAVETLLGQLAADVAALTDLLTTTHHLNLAASGHSGDGGCGGPGRVWSWLQPTRNAEQATEDLMGLVGWIGQVWLRFDHAALPSCWEWHPGVVEELWWCWHAWASAYTGDPPDWFRVADWHDHYRPGAVRRIHEATKTCDLSRHADPTTGITPVAPLAEAAEQIAAAWASPAQLDWPPKPSGEQLAAAEAHDTPRHPRRGATPTDRSR